MGCFSLSPTEPENKKRKKQKTSRQSKRSPTSSSWRREVAYGGGRLVLQICGGWATCLLWRKMGRRYSSSVVVRRGCSAGAIWRRWCRCAIVIEAPSCVPESSILQALTSLYHMIWSRWWWIVVIMNSLCEVGVHCCDESVAEIAGLSLYVLFWW